MLSNLSVYNEHNISVFQFCKMCERAFNLISTDQEYLLVQLIINTQEHAYQAVEGSEMYFVSLLIKRLKAIFSPNKSLDQYRSELANIYIRHNENILDYIARVKDLRTAIMEGEYNCVIWYFRRTTNMHH